MGSHMAAPQGQVIIVGVTGASGAILAQTALRLLAADERVARVHLVVSDAGRRLLDHELGLRGALGELPGAIVGPNAGRGVTARSAAGAGKIEVLPNADVGASIASGSYPADAMCVIPCSMGMLSAIATGASTDLVSRAADVSLKEGRRLVLCIRDTPFSRIHMENMLRAQQAGATIMPAIPSFYHHPQTIDDLVTQYVCRVLGQLGLPQSKQFAWTGQNAGMNAAQDLAQDEVHDEIRDEVQELGNEMQPSTRKMRSV
jgi:flavin prenyltransferase